MIVIIFAVLSHLRIGSCEPTNSACRVSLNDTIPAEKIIPYSDDSSIRKDGKSLFLSNIAKYLQISSLKDDTKGMHIRIWIWGYHSPNYVTTIYKHGSNADCSTISWSGRQVDSARYIIVHHYWTKLMPKSGWNKFFSTLNGLGITTLEGGLSYSQHRGHLTRMSYVQFEIVENGKYRYYEYLEPSYYRYVENGSMKIYQFLKYFDREMNLNIYQTNDGLFEEP